VWSLSTSDEQLSLEETRTRLLAALSQRWPDVSFQLDEHGTLARDYGWVFRLDVTGQGKDEETVPRLALVNALVSQVVWTDKSYSLEEFAEVFEGLLKRSRSDATRWCLTNAIPSFKTTDLAEEARAAGLRQLTLL
jgi:hypothetical protein